MLTGLRLKFNHAYNLLKQRKKELSVNWRSKNHIGKIIDIAIPDILAASFSSDIFIRYDIIVRYIAIHDYYSGETTGRTLYQQMQSKRANESVGESAYEDFVALIDSFDHNGYDESHPVILDSNFHIIDGSHRVALSIYHHVNRIKALIIDEEFSVDYGLDWFFSNGFQPKDILFIESVKNTIIYNLSTVLKGIIWSPAVEYSETIFQIINLYGKVSNIKSFEYGEEEYYNVVRALYRIDDIAGWKIEKKIDHMKTGPYRLIAFDIHSSSPLFRRKSGTSTPLSKKSEIIKLCVRSNIKDLIEDYYHDILLHIADNSIQSYYMDRVLVPNIDLTDFFESIKGLKYALVKTIDSGYFPRTFPHDIPVGKDIDIICDKEDFYMIEESIIDYFSGLNEYQLRILNGAFGTYYRLEFSKCLIFQIDLSWSNESLTQSFYGELLLNRQIVDNSSYYVDSLDFEIYIRLLECIIHPEKKQHLQFVQTHRSLINRESLNKYFSDKSLVDVQEFIKQIEERDC